jgi:hypothetical protein
MLLGGGLESRHICQMMVLDGSRAGVGDFAARLPLSPFVLHGIRSSSISSRVLSLHYR